MVGCGVVAGIAVLSLIACVVWLSLRCTRTVEMTTLAVSNAVAVVHLTDCSDDEGVAAFLGKVVALHERMQLEALRQAEPSGVGTLMEVMIRMRGRGTVDAGDLPEVFLAAQSRAAESNMAAIVGVGLDSVPRSTTFAMRLMLRAVRQGGVGLEHRGVEVADLEGDAQFAMTRGLFLFSTEVSSMYAAIDNVFDENSAAPIFASAPVGFAEEWDVYALGDNRGGALARLFAREDDDRESSSDGIFPERLPLPWRDARTMRAGIDFVDADRVRGEWVITCGDVRGAEYWRAAGEIALKKAVQDIDLTSREVRVTARVEGVDAIVTLEVSELDRVMDRIVQQMMSEEVDGEELDVIQERDTR